MITYLQKRKHRWREKATCSKFKAHCTVQEINEFLMAALTLRAHFLDVVSVVQTEVCQRDASQPTADALCPCGKIDLKRHSISAGISLFRAFHSSAFSKGIFQFWRVMPGQRIPMYIHLEFTSVKLTTEKAERESKTKRFHCFQNTSTSRL